MDRKLADAIRRHTRACRACKEPIVLASTENGETMPVQPEPSRDGNVLLNVFDGVLYAGVLRKNQAAGARDQGRSLFMPHWATCPDADKQRKRKGQKR